MKLPVFRQEMPVGWSFPEEVAVLCLAFAAQNEQDAVLEGQMAALLPEVPLWRCRTALEIVQALWKGNEWEILVDWVLEERAPRWTRRQRRHILQVLTNWAVASGALRAQLQILVRLEQIGEQRSQRGRRYEDRPPR